MSLNDAASVLPVTPATPGKKYFSAAEANRALPYVTRVVGDITAAYSQVVGLRGELEATLTEEDQTRLEKAYDAAMDRLGELVDELQTVGVELKDFETGLVDFPARHEGRDVLLCWRAGEKRVAHWHEVDGGFAGRQPVELLSQ